jgi:hypothetical protein
VSNDVFLPEEAEAIKAALDTLGEEIITAATDTVYDDDDLMPTPFTPASSALDDAIAGFIPTPYTAEQVRDVQHRAMSAARDKLAGRQAGARATLVLNTIFHFIPRVLGGL